MFFCFLCLFIFSRFLLFLYDFMMYLTIKTPIYMYIMKQKLKYSKNM